MVTFVTPPNLIPTGACKTNGNQIVDVNGNPIRLKCVGWNGGNTINATQLEGFSNASYQTHIDNMIRLGFNCARILTPARGVLNGESLLSTYDQMLDYAATKGFRFIVDIHNAEGTNSGNFGTQPPNGLWYDSGGASNGTDGGGTTGTITDALFTQAWQTLATRWKNKPAILAYDLQNEPQAAGHATPGSTWGGQVTGAGITGVVGSNQDIRAMYQRVGNAIHAIDPNPLIICESLIDYNSIHPAGDLRGVQNWPVVLNQANKVVYSPHEYGQFIPVFQGQAYIDQMMTSWGWMIAQNKYPIFIGEMGGNMAGSNGVSQANMAAWANTILPFMNGQWANTFTFTGSQQGIGSDWWVWSNGDGGEQDFTLITSWTNPSITAVNKPFLDQLQPFSVAAGPIPVPAPLTGTVTQGQVLAIDERYTGITLPSGKPFHYDLIYPAQYNKTLYKYPLYIWLHPDGSGNSWYQSGGDANKIANTYEGVALNTVDFRTKWPCFVALPFADQEQDSAIANWGGWTNTGGTGSGTQFNGETGPNTFALNAMVQSLLNQNLGIDPNRIYVVGFSLGGIGAEYLMLRYNQVNGNPKLYTAASSTGGVLEIHGFGSGPTTADVTTMVNVPVWWVSGQGDGTSRPADWNLPMWRALAGNSNYPTPNGNPTASSAQAGTSQMHFWYDPNMGHSDIAQNGSFYGVNPTIMNWMFAQSGSGGTIVTPPPPPPGPSSPDGTVVLLGSSASITDSSGNQWTLTSGGVVNINGGAAGFTQNVIEIAWSGGLIYQENTAFNWWYWDGSTWQATTAPIITVTKTISCNTITGLLANTTFTVSGLLTNYPTAPTSLKMSDDNGALVNIPTGNTISNTRYSFTHAGVLPGNHTIYIADGSNTSIQSAAVTYSAQGNAVKTIVINSLTNLKSNTAFNVSGALGGYTIQPSLTYSDDNGIANAITSGTTTTLFNFTHPGLLPGSHTIKISDGTNFNTASYTLTTQVTASPNNSFILLGNTSPLIDSAGNQWTLTSGGQVANNGVVDTSTSNVIEMAYSNSLLWQENASNLWWYWGPGWLPLNGTSVSPLPTTPTSNTKTIIVNQPSGAKSGSPFTVSGTLSNYTTSSAPASGRFSVINGKIVDPNGIIFNPKGIAIEPVDLPFAVTNAQGAPLTTFFPNINIVRLFIADYNNGGSQSASYSAGSVANIQSYVNILTNLGIVVAINDGTTSDGTNNGGGVGTNYTVANGFLTPSLNYYKSVATAFLNNPYVWFGSRNEAPNSSQGALTTEQKAMYDAIRGTGNQSIIEFEMVGGGTPGGVGFGSGTLGANNPDGLYPNSVYNAMTNIVWGPHFYDWMTQQSTDNNYCRSVLDTIVSQSAQITSADGVVPVVIWEYGITVGGGTETGGINIGQVMQASPYNGIAWSFDQYQGQNSLTNLPGASSLTSWGNMTKAWIQANASGGPAQQPAQKLTLKYGDDGGALLNLPTGNTVSNTSFSFTHPALLPGIHTLAVTDGAGVFGNISYILSSTTTTRNYEDNPGGNRSVWVTPFGDGAIWGATTDADTVAARHGGFINRANNYGVTVWHGTGSDPVHTVQATGSYAKNPQLTVQLHIPTGAYESTPNGSNNNPTGFWDTAGQPGKSFSFGPLAYNGQTITNLQPNDSPLIGTLGEYNDATADNFGEDQETGNYGYDIIPGLITGYDIDSSRNPNWPRIQHGLRYTTDATYLKSGNTGPTTFNDTFATLPLHNTWQSGDKWQLIAPDTTGGRGGPNFGENGDQWWVNPFNTNTPISGIYNATPSGLQLGLINTPAAYASYINSQAGTTLPYVGGLLNTSQSLYQKYGYWEIMVAVPAIPGFTFQADIENVQITGQWPPEIDLRIYTSANGIQTVLFEFANIGGGWTTFTLNSPTFDASVMHLYGMNWQSDFITFYVDNIQVAQYPTPQGGAYTTNPMFMFILTGANYIGIGDPAPTSLPAYATIQRITVYPNKTSGTGDELGPASWPQKKQDVQVVGNTSLNTPASIIAYLNSIAGTKTLSGQYIERGPLTPISNIQASTGKWLGFIEGDLWYFGSTGAADGSVIPILQAYGQAGGLVGLSMCMPNPSTGGGIDSSGASLANIITNGSAANTAFLNILSQVAALIRILKNAGIPVRLRPFHEMNGNWFWWGTQAGTDAQFVQMWQIMWNYLVVTQGLDNIYFLYSVNAGMGIGSTIQNRYPGSAYVDMVGQDLYSSNPNDGVSTYNSLLGFNKPVCLSEFGSGSPSNGDTSFNLGTLVASINSAMPKTVSWTNWWDGNSGGNGWGMAENIGVSAALALPRVLNRGDFSGGSINTTYTGNLVAGTTLGIPMNTAMPSGLSFWGQQLFWNAQHYPWLFRDSSPGGLKLYCDQVVAANNTVFNQIATDLPTIVQLLRPLKNQHIGGTSLLATPKNGPGNRVDIGPPPLSSTVVNPQTITIDTISTINQGTLFTVTGSLNGYTNIPTLTFRDDNGAVQTLPSGATVNLTRFSFVHSGMPSGNHNIIITDGLINSDPTIYVVVPTNTGGGNPSVSFVISPLGNTSNFNIPSNWNNNNNLVEAIGGGGSGSNRGNSGGAGAYAKIVNFIANGGTNVPYIVGRGGASANSATGASGGDTTFNNNSLVAKGGQGAASGGGAIGGQASASVGFLKTSGGNAPTTTATYGAQGGAGAGGSIGQGANGGQGGLAPAGGGGGGGASDGGSDGSQPDPTGTPGIGGTASSKGARGGDGGAGSNGAVGSSGQAGQTGTEWDTTHGSGSGGGGSGGNSPSYPYITAGNGSFTDSAGNVYTITSALVAMENGTAIPGGAGTGAMAYVAPTVYGQDNASGNWFIWDQTTWTASAAPAGVGSGGGTVTPPPTPNDTFNVSGGQIKRNNGSVFYGKGPNINDFVMSGAVDGNANPLLQYFPGTNMIRLNLRSFATPATWATAINTLTSKGIVVLAEAHWVNGNKLALTGSALTTEANWYASWASYYKTNSYVWFGTPNEPQDTNGSQDICNEHQAIYNAIRATGSNAIILFQPYGGGNPNQLGDLKHNIYTTMTNVGFDMHFYNWVTNYSGDQTTITNKLNSMANQLRSQNPTASGVPPVVIGEWGDSTDAESLDNGWQQVVQAVTTNGFSGHLAWNWNSTGPYDALFVNNTVSSGLSAFGRLVQTAIGTTPAITQVGSNTSSNTTTTGSYTNWYENPGEDGRFWKKPFQSSAHWITSGSIITALRGGTPTLQTKGNYSVPFYIGKAGDPLVTVALTNGAKSVVVPIPLGSQIEGPSSSVDQSVGGVDMLHPYRVWSISGAQMYNSSGQVITQVQASGTVIRGTYGLAIQDGSGPIMEDIVTGAMGDNNSIGGIQDLELGLITADPNYIIPHMLAFQTDVSFQASSAGPIWPLKITDVSSGGVSNPYQGPIPQGVTIGIPASTPRPTGKSRGFYALWDQLQRFGMFNYNFGQVGGVNFCVYDSTGKYASLVADIQSSWVEIGRNYICILDYNNGVSGAQYSVATSKGAISGSTNAFPAPPPLDLSPTGGVNVLPSTFNAWYPSGYNVIPSNPGANTSGGGTSTGGGSSGGSTTILNGGNGGNYGGGGGGSSDINGIGGNGGQGIIVVTNIPTTTGLVWVDSQIFNMYS